MKPLKQTTFSIFCIAFFIAIAPVFSQSYKETFEVNPKVRLVLNTSHTELIFESWNKNKVEVTAYIESESLSEKEKEALFDAWQFNVLGKKDKVVITSNAGVPWLGLESLASLAVFDSLWVPSIPIQDFVMPVIADFEMPELPNYNFTGMKELQFDYQAFKNDETRYMKEWEAKIKEKFGDDFEEKMEAWGEAFAEKWHAVYNDSLMQDFEIKMETWGENFEDKMKAYEEKMAKWEKEMETKTAVLAKKAEAKAAELKKEKESAAKSKTAIAINGNFNMALNTNAKRVIKIKMPKQAETELNVTHGKIKMLDLNK